MNAIPQSRETWRCKITSNVFDARNLYAFVGGDDYEHRNEIRGEVKQCRYHFSRKPKSTAETVRRAVNEISSDL